MSTTRVFTEDQLEKQKQFQTWIKAYGKSYLSTPLHEYNIEENITNQKVESSESKLRKHNKVKLYPDDTFDISHLIAEFKRSRPNVPKRVAMQTSISISNAWRFGFISDEQIRTVIHNEQLHNIKLKDGKEYKIFHDPKNATTKVDLLDNTFFWIEGIPSLEKSYIGLNLLDEDKSYRVWINELSKRYQCHEKLIEMALDITSDDPIDKILAKVWESYKTLHGEFQEIAKYLKQARELCVRPSLITEKYSIDFNKIDWRSDVIVLQAHPEKVKSVVDEDRLAMPFESKGEHCAIDLTAADTFVIGPKATLSRFSKQEQDKLIDQACSSLPRDVNNIIGDFARNIRFVYLEDLNNEQLKFLNVPAELHPQKLQAASLIVNLLDQGRNLKMRFFDRWRQFKKENEPNEKLEKQKNVTSLHLNTSRMSR